MSTKEPRYLPRQPGTEHAPGNWTAPLYADASFATRNHREGLLPENGYIMNDPQDWRLVHSVHNSSMRTAFPGQPGYSGSGDEPSAVPRSILYGGDKGRVLAENPEARNDFTDNLMHGHNPSQSWLNVIGERAYNSPRFYAAVQAHLNESLDNSGGFVRDADLSAMPHRLSGEGTPMDKWNRGNMGMASVYWKAHQAVASGKFDQDDEGNAIPDPFEDAARVAPRARTGNLNDSARARWRPITRKGGQPFISKQTFQDGTDPRILDWKPDGSTRGWKL